MMLGMDRCKVCGQEIRWGTDQDGRRVPLDKEPSPAGTFAVLNEERRTVLSLPLGYPRFNELSDLDKVLFFQGDQAQTRRVLDASRYRLHNRDCRQLAAMHVGTGLRI